MTIIIAATAFIMLGASLILAEVLIARHGIEPYKGNPSGQLQQYGPAIGYRLNLLVLGDSTGAGQGAAYPEGIAVKGARCLSEDRPVTLKNIAVSGATVGDVVDEQLLRIGDFKPDIVLVSAGANDVTKLSPASRVERNLVFLTDELRRRNPAVKIFLTGAPDMGSPPRLLQPLRALMGWRAEQLNTTFRRVVERTDTRFIPIAEKTGPLFRADPGLFSEDRFHPNARGYQVWSEVICSVLETELGTR